MGQQSIKFVVEFLFADAAVGKYFYDFSLLMIFQIQSLNVSKCLDVIIWTYDSLENGLFDICSHVLLFGQL